MQACNWLIIKLYTYFLIDDSEFYFESLLIS